MISRRERTTITIRLRNNKTKYILGLAAYEKLQVIYTTEGERAPSIPKLLEEISVLYNPEDDYLLSQLEHRSIEESELNGRLLFVRVSPECYERLAKNIFSKCPGVHPSLILRKLLETM